METKTVTLREAADILHEQGIEIEWDGKCSLQSFFDYFDIHYKDDCEKRTLPSVPFFFTDILNIFK